MTGKEFLNSLAKGKTDILEQLLGMLAETHSECHSGLRTSCRTLAGRNHEHP